VIGPPSFDPRNIVDLVAKYGDAHIIDNGWREVDTEEWYEESLDAFKTNVFCGEI
jgi:hypothetical protein